MLMLFSRVASVFEELESVSSRTEITELLSKLFTEAAPEEAGLLSYLMLGNLYPKFRSTTFNFAEKSMVSFLEAELFADKVVKKQKQLSFLGLFSTPEKAVGGSGKLAKKTKELGDVGSAIFYLLKELEIEDDSNLSLVQVYEDLKNIEKISGSGSQEIKAEMLVDLVKKLSPVEAKFVVRIILGKLRLGFSEMTILDSVSWAEAGDKSLRVNLEQAYNICADIGLIAKKIKDGGIEAIEQLTAMPGVPIRMAAAEREEDAHAILAKLGPCVAQPKLDGLRLQVHLFVEDGERVVKFVSRNLQDVTEMFPDLAKAVLSLKSDSLIAEGEAIAIDTESGAFLPFQETSKRRRKKEVDLAIESRPMRLYLFDCLYEGAQLLLSQAHSERRKRLVALVGEDADSSSIIQAIEEATFETGEDLENYFDEQISMGLEGIIAKRIDAPYVAGKRNFNWIKLKRIEKGNLDDTIDAVILGYYSGKGKRAGFGIGALLVGLFNDKEDRFESVAKIGTGLTDQEWRDYKAACDQIKVNEQPHNVVVAKELAPDVWVEPKLVTIIRADEISVSPLHSAGKTEEKSGLALRFPRVMGLREDKAARDATTVIELKRLKELQQK
jgi:DNA ligase 1